MEEREASALLKGTLLRRQRERGVGSQPFQEYRPPDHSGAHTNRMSSPETTEPQAEPCSTQMPADSVPSIFGSLHPAQQTSPDLSLPATQPLDYADADNVMEVDGEVDSGAVELNGRASSHVIDLVDYHTEVQLGQGQLPGKLDLSPYYSVHYCWMCLNIYLKTLMVQIF